MGSRGARPDSPRVAEPSSSNSSTVGVRVGSVAASRAEPRVESWAGSWVALVHRHQRRARTDPAVNGLPEEGPGLVPSARGPADVDRDPGGALSRRTRRRARRAPAGRHRAGRARLDGGTRAETGGPRVRDPRQNRSPQEGSWRCSRSARPPSIRDSGAPWSTDGSPVAWPCSVCTQPPTPRMDGRSTGD